MKKQHQYSLGAVRRRSFIGKAVESLAGLVGAILVPSLGRAGECPCYNPVICDDGGCPGPLWLGGCQDPQYSNCYNFMESFSIGEAWCFCVAVYYCEPEGGAGTTNCHLANYCQNVPENCTYLGLCFECGGV